VTHRLQQLTLIWHTWIWFSSRPTCGGRKYIRLKLLHCFRISCAEPRIDIFVFFFAIVDYILPWEDERSEYPTNMARPLNIAIEASNGASDYGNKFGEPIIAGFARSFGLELPGSGERREWIKPIMFTGGIGSISNEHVHKQSPTAGSCINNNYNNKPTISNMPSHTTPITFWCVCVYCVYWIFTGWAFLRLWLLWIIPREKSA